MQSVPALCDHKEPAHSTYRIDSKEHGLIRKILYLASPLALVSINSHFHECLSRWTAH